RFTPLPSMSHPTSRFAMQRATLALALLAGLSGCQTPVVVAPPPPASAAPDRNAEIARILELKKRGVISDAQAVAIINALVAGDTAPEPVAPEPTPAEPVAAPPP